MQVESSTSGIYSNFCWSGAAEVAYQGLKFLPNRIKNHLFIVTIGGARIITDKALLGYRNIVDIKDFIPYIADPIGIIKGYFKKDVEFVNSGRWFGFGHDFYNPAYQAKIQDTIDLLNNQYGGKSE